MALLRTQKETLVKQLTSDIEQSRVALVFAYSKLDSKKNLSLRDKAFEQDGKVKMMSNNLMELVLKNNKRELELPQKQLALAYGFKDEVMAAKLLADFAKETENLEILAGWIDGKFFTAADVKTLSSLPSKEVLQAQVVGRLNGLIQGLVYSLNYPIQKFAYVMSAIESNKSN